ncbi:hypothetical protein E2C01_100702 [Portunus trituberculatus]|uniref:Uncharacterized protein n=1 Tax=Portunus trituberculatus TaxID=210409 RepID=A0A5B7KK31_PORTR|nr:hypothetical protein [Portunus trituberculatus]
MWLTHHRSTRQVRTGIAVSRWFRPLPTTRRFCSAPLTSWRMAAWPATQMLSLLHMKHSYNLRRLGRKGKVPAASRPSCCSVMGGRSGRRRSSKS